MKCNKPASKEWSVKQPSQRGTDLLHNNNGNTGLLTLLPQFTQLQVIFLVGLTTGNQERLEGLKTDTHFGTEKDTFLLNRPSQKKKSDS